MKKELINPEGVFAHPAYTGVATVTDPRKFHFFAGRTPADFETYEAVHVGQLVRVSNLDRRCSGTLQCLGVLAHVTLQRENTYLHHPRSASL